MKMLIWHEDKDTALWADRIQLVTWPKQPQNDGSNSRGQTSTWKKRILRHEFPNYCYVATGREYLLPSPKNIIRCWTDGCELEALALTVRWGRMRKIDQTIYHTGLPLIQAALCRARQSIENTQSIRPAWEDLVKSLGWSAVITSKCLHFLARSLGYESNPPVPIDWAIINDKVAIEFDRQMKQMGGNPKELGAWLTTSWDSYNCYMTAILRWAATRQWTTTETENTLFAEYR